MRITLTKAVRNRLERELKTAQRLSNLRLYKMAKSILMIGDNHPIHEVAKFFNVSPRTVSEWLSRFLADRFAWLIGHHYRGRGRKCKLNKEQKDKLFRIVEEGPEKYGFDCGIWTCAMIGEVVFREFNVTYNPRYLSSLLKGIGLSYQKAKFESDHLDDAKRKEWVEVTWPKILKEAKDKKAVILFGDEVSFAQWGSLARTWAPRGKQPRIKTTGKRKGMKIFGVVEFFGGDFHYMETPEKFNAQTYVEFLQHVVARYSQPMILIEDGAKYHFGPAVKEFKEKMKTEGRLYTHKLPSYSPDYNPIEKLWKKTKSDATHCKYFPTFEDLRLAVLKAFEKYMKDATRVLSVMKKLRQNAGVA